MTYWKSTNGTIGSAPASIMIDAIADIRAQYREDLGRDPTKLEICELVGLVLATTSDLVYRDEPGGEEN